MVSVQIRPPPAASLTRVAIEGPAGGIETDINDPGDARRGIALIAHPNPLQGGTKDNKVVTTLAKAFFALGHVAARPNFRGVGASAGYGAYTVAFTELGYDPDNSTMQDLPQINPIASQASEEPES